MNTIYLCNVVKSEAEFGEDDLDEVQKLLVSAARDCVPQDRNSFVEFQANTGVEVTITLSSTEFISYSNSDSFGT